MNSQLQHIGIDFEYANSNRASICAYGLAFEDGSTEHGFVQLHPDHSELTNSLYNGNITREQIESGISFLELYARIAELTAADDTVFVAHDLKSDRRAFQAAQLQNGLEALPLLWIDSLHIARAEVKASGIPGKTGIAAMAERYGIPGEHHNPAYDALISLEIVKRNEPTKIIISDAEEAQRVKRVKR